jgi:hypothetical protein
MSDDKSKRGPADRSRVAGGEKWEVSYVAKKLNVSEQAVKEAIKKVGPSRERVEAELKKRK